MSFYEHHKRSLLKSITFRIVVICTDFVVVYFITHRVEIAVELIIATNIASTIMYYLHERAWNVFSWGRRHTDRTPHK